MEAFGHFIAGLFSRPRLTWAALAVAATTLLALHRFGVMRQSGSAFEQTTILTAWIVLAVSISFLVLTVFTDAWTGHSKNRLKQRSLGAAKREFLEASPHSRAIICWMVINSENCLWLMNDYKGLSDFIIKKFGYVSGRHGSAVEIECSSVPYNWVRDNLATLTDSEVGSSAREDLFSSMKLASQELRGFGG